MKEIGKSPVVLKKEITGFIVNRVQVAFLRECFNLIEQGICTAEDIDIAVRGSMGFKWAFCGPLESQDLAGSTNNSSNGWQYLKRFIQYERSGSILK